MKNSTHYRLRALACALLASAAMLGACDDDDPNDDPDPGKKPPVTLTDQIQYDGGDLVGIKSAIYVAEEDGSHTFYLSPTEGLINAEQMKQADDYLRVMVESPKGTVNTASDPFEIEYKDISVKKTTMNDVASVELSADLVTETRLNLYTYVELKSGKTLIARYQNTCTEERDVELTNQYEIDNRIAAVGSVVEWRNVREGNRRFCLYEQEGLAAPEEGAAGVEILLAEELFGTAEIDLATADPAKVQIRCGEFATGAGTTGTLTAKYLTDKFGTIEGLIVALDASKDGKRLRAAYEGTFAGGYAATNTIKVTEPAAGGEAAAAAGPDRRALLAGAAGRQLRIRFGRCRNGRSPGRSRQRSLGCVCAGAGGQVRRRDRRCGADLRLLVPALRPQDLSDLLRRGCGTDRYDRDPSQSRWRQGDLSAGKSDAEKRHRGRSRILRCADGCDGRRNG